MVMENNKQENKKNFAFGKRNYIIMTIGLIILAAGYILLSGGGSKDPDYFNEALFNARRLVVAPLLIMAGLIVEVYAIMTKNK